MQFVITGIGDFNGDGKSDIFWQHTGNKNIVWLMNGSTLVSSTPIVVITDNNFQLQGYKNYEARLPVQTSVDPNKPVIMQIDPPGEPPELIPAKMDMIITEPSEQANMVLLPPGQEPVLASPIPR